MIQSERFDPLDDSNPYRLPKESAKPVDPIVASFNDGYDAGYYKGFSDGAGRPPVGLIVFFILACTMSFISGHLYATF